MANPMKAPVCDATVLMSDDRWGGVIELPCELAADHDGAHSHAMTGCEPVAELVWWTEQ